MQHSNSLLAVGAAMRLMNAVRIWGSPHRICRASCSCAGFGWPFCCHNYSQVACWYFWMTFSATMSTIGN
jgi:hypothetical protein